MKYYKSILEAARGLRDDARSRLELLTDQAAQSDDPHRLKPLLRSLPLQPRVGGPEPHGSLLPTKVLYKSFENLNLETVEGSYPLPPELQFRIDGSSATTMHFEFRFHKYQYFKRKDTRGICFFRSSYAR